jgi:hypothetical protein
LENCVGEKNDNKYESNYYDGTTTRSSLYSKVCKLNHQAWMNNFKKLEETIQRVATNTIGYTRNQANKEWFDEECAKVNEEKNAVRERAIQIKTR